jgi:hypothetical protein
MIKHKLWDSIEFTRSLLWSVYTFTCKETIRNCWKKAKNIAW